MKLLFVRLPLTLLYGWFLYRALTTDSELSSGQFIGLTLYALLGAVFISTLWAPVIGERISDPLTGTLTQETSLPPDSNALVRWIRYFQRKGFHRVALLLVFVEGIRHPDLPQPALLGLRSVREGSFLERVFAFEVYRYNNIQNCLHAHKILTERHNTVPPLHKHPEVNLAIMNLNREPHREPVKFQVKTPEEKPPPPPRNPRIRLFSDEP